ncbi:MAG: hypothetical protein IKS85_04955 [Lachnospiraceae bacterium]|nr:hypothetical protein [Lachnospiraceae bacterium]
MKLFMTFTKLELLNLFGLNVLRHVKDPAEKKKKTLLALTLLFVVIILGAYLSFSAYAMTILGIGHKIPMIFSLLSSVCTLLFGLFKAKSYLYRDKDMDLLASLPAGSLPIVSARLFHVYVENFLISAVILLPSFTICALRTSQGAAFFLNLLLALFILPILPTALIALFGIAVAALVARNRHKVLTETIFVLIIVILSLLMPAFFSSVNGNGSQPMRVDFFAKDASSDEVIQQLAAQSVQAFADMEASFPLLKTWGSMFQPGHVTSLLLYGTLSGIILFLTALLIGKHFFEISAKLFPASTRHEFRMKELHSETILIALIRKEAKRYFSSGTYVTNTIIGPVFAVVLAIAFAFFDPEAILSSMGNVPEGLDVKPALPFLFGMFYCMMTISSSSLSMEGKNWWILQSLPVGTKTVMQAKLLFNLIFLAPFYVTSEIVLLFTLQATLLERFWLLVIPAVIILFAVMLGLFCNVKFPKFQWTSDIEVVKQSAAGGLSLLGMFAALLPGILLMVAPATFRGVITLCALTLIIAVTILLYRQIIRAKL